MPSEDVNILPYEGDQIHLLVLREGVTDIYGLRVGLVAHMNLEQGIICGWLSLFEADVHNMFRCLIQGSFLVSISSILSSSGSGWAETMLTETGSNNVPTLTSELKDEVLEEWSYLASGLESTSDLSGVELYPNPRW